MDSVFEAWDEHISARLGATKLSNFHVELPEGKIHVTPCGGDEYLATIHWPRSGGVREIARTSAQHILSLVQDQLIYGISFPPPYREGETAHELACEGRIHRRVLPEGELRIVPHADGHIGLLLLPDGLRLLGWSEDLESAHETSRRLIHLAKTRRMTVRLHGRIHDLRFSQIDGILAFCVCDDRCVLLVPETSYFNENGMWDASVRVLVLRRDEALEHVWTHPSLASLSGNDFVWSDEWPRSANSPVDAEHPRASWSWDDEGRDAQTRAQTGPRVSTPITPRLQRLVCHWLDTLDHTKGDGKAARVELDGLLRDILMYGAEDIRGCGRGLRDALEQRGGYDLRSSARALRYAIAFFAARCPRLFQRFGKRDTLIALSLLRPGTELACWLEETYGALEPRSGEEDPAEPASPPRDDPPGGIHAGAHCMEAIHVEPDAAAPPPFSEHEPPPATSEVPASSSPPVEESGHEYPWDLDSVPPEVVASVARYLGKPNAQERTEPRVPGNPPSGWYSNLSRSRRE